jgi:hypothetical protein
LWLALAIGPFEANAKAAVCHAWWRGGMLMGQNEKKRFLNGIGWFGVAKNPWIYNPQLSIYSIDSTWEASHPDGRRPRSAYILTSPNQLEKAFRYMMQWYVYIYMYIYIYVCMCVYIYTHV